MPKQRVVFPEQSQEGNCEVPFAVRALRREGSKVILPTGEIETWFHGPVVLGNQLHRGREWGKSLLVLGQ